MKPSTNPAKPDLFEQIYQFLLQMSTGKSPALPKITQMAKEMGISRAAIYAWLNGEFGSQRIARYLESVTGIAFPVRVEHDNIHMMRLLFRIRE